MIKHNFQHHFTIFNLFPSTVALTLCLTKFIVFIFKMIFYFGKFDFILKRIKKIWFDRFGHQVLDRKAQFIQLMCFSCDNNNKQIFCFNCINMTLIFVTTNILTTYWFSIGLMRDFKNWHKIDGMIFHWIIYVSWYFLLNIHLSTIKF